ncbi:MAG: M28 family peptidase [Planctomycetota bacterium]
MRCRYWVVPLTLAQLLPAQRPPGHEVEHLITADRIGAAIRLLSSDLFEGRGVGTRADELTRLYLETQFELFGLEPGGENGTWQQPVPIAGITTEVTTPLTIQGTGGKLEFIAPADYTAAAARADATTAWQDAEVVFVGYGIHAPEQRWDDYGDFDLKGKVALVMNNDPGDDPDLFAGSTRLYYGRWSYKFEEAARRGAVGAMVIHTTPSAGYPFQVIQATHGREAFWLPFDGKTPHLAIRSWCAEEAARSIAAAGGHDLDELRRRAESRDFQPVPLGVTANLATTNTKRDILSGNVLGKIEGSDPTLKEQVVVITAHFDHLGIGRPKKEDAIYNGALDNASGTALLLNLAQACAQLPQPPRRTLLFAAVTAEESGLLGSLYFARHPTIPARQIVANYNVDGINIWGPTSDIAMIGHGKNTLTDLATRVAKGRGRDLVADQHPELGLFYRSDHFSFARIGVPSAYFKAGGDFLENKTGRSRVKNMYTTVHYHQPSDQYDRRWNLEGAVEDGRLLLECLLRTAQADNQPRWTPGDEFEAFWQPATPAPRAGGAK